MIWFGVCAALLILTLLFWILHLRKSSVTIEKSRFKLFQSLAKELDLRFVTDDYFMQLEGSWNGMPVIVYPHNFEGPGMVTLFYLETTILANDRNWIEPNLSLGRALVEWKRQIPFSFEVTGTQFTGTTILEALNPLKLRYPYVAITLPWRFSYSPLLQNSLKSWKNYAVFLAMDAGKHPAKEQVEQAIKDAASVALVIRRGRS